MCCSQSHFISNLTIKGKVRRRYNRTAPTICRSQTLVIPRLICNDLKYYMSTSTLQFCSFLITEQHLGFSVPSLLCRDYFDKISICTLNSLLYNSKWKSRSWVKCLYCNKLSSELHVVGQRLGNGKPEVEILLFVFPRSDDLCELKVDAIGALIVRPFHFEVNHCEVEQFCKKMHRVLFGFF